MTIPSRPAPPPPQQQQQIRRNGNNSQAANPNKLSPLTLFSKSLQTKSKGYGTVTNSSESTLYESVGHVSGNVNVNKKKPPPRPPPPKVNLSAGKTGETVLIKPGPPQSINVLSNIFGKKRTKQQQQQQQQQQQHSFRIQPPPNNLTPKTQRQFNINFNNNTTIQQFQLQQQQKYQQKDNEIQLINFDSPPSSPTLTQKSNSDCVSVDSFSSDSNFSSPHNGSTSQPESGFEDDFISPTDPWETLVNDSFNPNIAKDSKITQNVRNLHSINNSQTDNFLCNGKSLLPPPSTLVMPTIIKPKTLQQQQNTRYSPTTTYSTIGKTSETNQSSFSTKYNYYEESSYTVDDSLPSPPMPNCPPPPPPPQATSSSSSSSKASNVLAVVTGKLDAINLGDNTDLEGPSYGIALYDFEGVEDGDLSFRKSEKIYLLQRLNEEWFLGRNRKGCEGIFPANYIDIMVPLKEDNSSKQLQCNQQQNATFVQNENNLKRGRVLYNFAPEAPEDLSLNIGDIVTVLYRINEDWLYGEINNRKGQFPENFIEYI